MGYWCLGCKYVCVLWICEICTKFGSWFVFFSRSWIRPQSTWAWFDSTRGFSQSAVGLPSCNLTGSGWFWVEPKLATWLVDTPALTRITYMYLYFSLKSILIVFGFILNWSSRLKDSNFTEISGIHMLTEVKMVLCPCPCGFSLSPIPQFSLSHSPPFLPLSISTIK